MSVKVSPEPAVQPAAADPADPADPALHALLVLRAAGRRSPDARQNQQG